MQWPYLLSLQLAATHLACVLGNDSSHELFTAYHISRQPRLWLLRKSASRSVCRQKFNTQFLCCVLFVQVDVGKEEAKVALLSALLLPVRALESQGKKGKSLPVVPLIVGESVKWKKSYASLTAEVQAQAPELLKVYQTLQVTIPSTHVFLEALDWVNLQSSALHICVPVAWYTCWMALQRQHRLNQVL